MPQSYVPPKYWFLISSYHTFKIICFTETDILVKMFLKQTITLNRIFQLIFVI